MRQITKAPPIFFLFLLQLSLWVGILLTQELPFKITLKSVIAGYSAQTSFSNPQGIFYDKRFKELYVCDSGNHQVVIFDSSGFPIYRFKHWVEREGKRMTGEPRSLVVNSEGNIFLTDNLADYIDILNQRGENIDQIKLAPLLKLRTAKAIGLAIDENDNLYVSYQGEDKSELVVLDPDLQPVLQLKNDAQNQQNFGDISGLWVDSAGKIYITDAIAEPCVKVFSKKGVYLLGFGKHDVGWDNFSLPSGIITSEQGFIWVVDAIRQVVKAFSAEGQYLQFIGGYGNRPGELDYPGAISGDGGKTIFILEKSGARFQEFKAEKE